MITAPRDPRRQVRLYANTYRVAEQEKYLFADVKAFCMFIGQPRSGHSLVGSLLDAHPRMIVAHQFNSLVLVESCFSKWQLYHLLLANSRRHAEEGRIQTGYSYDVPGQWQGRFETLEVIGDKAGGATAENLRAAPWLYDRLLATVEVPVRWVNVVRNPYDNISTMIARDEFDFDTAVTKYFDRCEVIAAVEGRAGADSFLSVRHENLIDEPADELRRLCEYLGTTAPDDYVAACAGILSAEPSRTREGRSWSDDERARVDAQVERFPFLAGYGFED